ncbi:heme-binding protein HmuY [Leptospira noumeaensis]|uniref:Heme-binding protein HmuY n=1 Tax=Leptospira noumeaensis TaxID=2484964 RepID=A0A4R9HYM0_9LEPT|nr:HmuY family protein [Leptospira noumeaensis]TGK77564.1 heme-binding protein HmuY [Leptospira noumeaensis]
MTIKSNFQTFKHFTFVILLFISFFTDCSLKQNSSDDSSALLLLVAGGVESGGIPCTVVPANAVNTTGTYTTVVNATSSCNWVYVSLKSNGVKVESTAQWDIALKRYNIQTNGGTSGAGSGGACKSGSTNFASSFTGAECTAVVDVRLSSSGGGPVTASSESINPVMAAPLDLTPMPAGYGAWYTYSDTILTAKSDVFIITGSDGSKYAIQMLDYYSAAGTSGNPKFQWKKL